MWIYDEDLNEPVVFDIVDGTVMKRKEAFFRWHPAGETIVKTLMWKVTIPPLSTKKYSVRATRSMLNGLDMSNEGPNNVTAMINGDLMWFGAVV